MRIEINGELRELAAGMKLSELISQLSMPDERVAVELNRTVIRRSEWPNTDVNEGDRLEIVHFVGGG